MTHSPTQEQSAILLAAKADGPSLLVNAYAGCAKTSTLEMLSHATPNVPTLALAFNVRIKKELATRLPPSFDVKTLNGLGHSAWGRAIGKQLALDDRKLAKQLTQLLGKESELARDGTSFGEILRLTSRAMQLGLVPSVFPNKSLVPDTLATWTYLAEDLWIDDPADKIDVARQLLIESIRMGFTGTVSFDDQIYLPTMFNGAFARYARVLGDEAQDFSPLNHLMLRKSCAGRLIVCGDRKQSIYGFRGADHQSMESIKRLRTEWTELPLATTFRCPHVVVDRQSSHAPGFVAWPTNPPGQFIDWTSPPGGDTPSSEWTWQQVQTQLTDLPVANPTVAVLCRNNAPLLAMAFRLIRLGVPPVMLGRDIGKGLTQLATKLFVPLDRPIESCLRLLAEWESNELTKAQVNGNESKLAGITDRADCLRAVAESPQVTRGTSLVAALDQLFARERGAVTLATGHKAKGLEWSLVIHLDPWRLPSRFAKQAMAAGNSAPMEQEKNLLYVIETRAQHTLINASLADFVSPSAT